MTEMIELNPEQWIEVYYSILDYGGFDPEPLIGVDGMEANVMRLTADQLQSFADAVYRKRVAVESGRYADPTETTHQWDAGAEWSVAETARGRLVVYLTHCNDGFAPSMTVYEGFDALRDAKDEHGTVIPQNVVAKVAAALGVPYEIRVGHLSTRARVTRALVVHSQGLRGTGTCTTMRCCGARTHPTSERVQAGLERVRAHGNGRPADFWRKYLTKYAGGDEGERPTVGAVPDLEFIRRQVPILEVAKALGLQFGAKGLMHCWHPELHEHGDRTASVAIWKAVNKVKCFGPGCDLAGRGPVGPVDLVMDMRKIGTGEAAQWIAERFPAVPMIDKSHRFPPDRPAQGCVTSSNWTS